VSKDASFSEGERIIAPAIKAHRSVLA